MKAATPGPRDFDAEALEQLHKLVSGIERLCGLLELAVELDEARQKMLGRAVDAGTAPGCEAALARFESAGDPRAGAFVDCDAETLKKYTSLVRRQSEVMDSLAHMADRLEARREAAAPLLVGGTRMPSSFGGKNRNTSP